MEDFMEDFIKHFTFYKLVDKIPTPCKLSEIDPEELKMQWSVKQSKIKGTRISTIFIGANINQFGGKPKFFETMVFGSEFDQYRVHDSTWDDAIETHDKICLQIIDSL